MHVHYHFTFGFTDRLRYLMQFSKVRMNQRYGLLPSNLCPIKQDDSDPKYYKKLQSNWNLEWSVKGWSQTYSPFNLTKPRSFPCCQLPCTSQLKLFWSTNSNQASSSAIANNVILEKGPSLQKTRQKYSSSYIHFLVISWGKNNLPVTWEMHIVQLW